MRKLAEDLWTFNTRDLMRSAGCSHCSSLAIAREQEIAGVRELIEQFEVEVDNLAVTYGKVFEEQLEQELLEYLGPDNFQRPLEQDQFAGTLELMRQGVPVIYQGYLKHRVGILEFNGKPDFLVRSDYSLEFKQGKLTASKSATEKSEPRYTSWDAKLASSAKPHYLLQIALYQDALAELGLKAEEDPGLILGSRELVCFEESEIVPAMALARAELSNAIRNFDPGTKLENLTLFCETKDGCKVCEYPDLCNHSRVEVDHLVQVAGINRTQIEKLKSVGITTMRQLAEASDDNRPTEILESTFNKIRTQAKLQTDFKESGRVSYLLLPDPEIAVLPPRSEGDVFFDMEGFPYFKEKGGLEYLFGNILRDGSFVPFFAHSRIEEKKAFQDFMDFLTKQLQKYPDAHVYHYANYEVSALSRLAARHGVLETQVSELIASGKMIDLYKVVKGSIMVSQPSYSIKKLEAFYDFERKSKVLDAGSSIDEYDYYRQLIELGEKAEASEVLQQITDYNEDDCVSTRALYDWLSSMPSAHSRYKEFKAARDIKKAREASNSADRDDSPESRRAEKAEYELRKLTQKTESMMSKVENWNWGKNSSLDYQAKIWLALTHSMLYYNREDVIRWRDWAIRKEATFDQLHRDRKALVVEGASSGSSEAQLFGLGQDEKTKLLYSYRLEPGQTCFLKAGSPIFVRYSLGANQQDTDYGKILEINKDKIVFERDATGESAIFEPNAIFENEWVPLGNKPQTVGELVQQLVNLWGSPEKTPDTQHPAMDLLLRKPPRLRSLSSLPKVQGDDYLSAILQAANELDNSVLAVQGPPGSGKTYLGSRVIADLVKKGMRVGVVANSHSAVENLLYACIDAGIPERQIAKRRQQGDKEVKPWNTPSGNQVLSNWRSGQEGYVVGGTSWVFCAKELLLEPFDYIFIDEAAQFSLVDAIAVSANSKNLVLLGDPQQLTQVIQAVHPGGVDNSALGHYMGDSQILEPEFGYFIEVTRRMHPRVNAPVSWLSYKNKLHSHPNTKANQTPGIAPGLILKPVTHFGNSSSSKEEALEVLEIVKSQVSAIGQEGILVVAPYNAQVDLIRETLDNQGLHNVAVGTVDKFQGREALVVVVSLAASSAEDAPRGLDFLLDRNRLNVALSRAKANCFLVYSPNLTRTRLKSIEEVRAVSRITGLIEFGMF